jgi:hypothetical protein
VFHDLLFLLGGLGDLCARSVFSASYAYVRVRSWAWPSGPGYETVSKMFSLFVPSLFSCNLFLECSVTSECRSLGACR